MPVAATLSGWLADPSALPAIDNPAGSGGVVLAWSLRGSPHLHRRKELRRFTAALWPTPDAAARPSGDAARLQTDGAVGTHVGTSATCARPALPDDLVPVTVAGVRSQAPASMLDELLVADLGEAAGITRLIPPSDPLLNRGIVGC